MADTPEPLIFAGSSHPELAGEIAKILGVRLGKIHLGRFPDKEISVQIQESVRGRDTFVLQTVAVNPNEYLIELLLIIDALRRASAGSITVVVPYFGYSRQDRKDKPRVPITAKLVANLLVAAGTTRILTMDLHAGQLQGFFDIPVDNLFARPILEQALKSKQMTREDMVIVAPDLGSIKIARDYANHLGVKIAVIDKLRASATKIETTMLIGDVKDKVILFVDDMISTAGTILSAAYACRKEGAREIYVATTHGFFVGNAIEKIEESPIEALLVSNTIPFSDKIKNCPKVHCVSIAPLIAQAIHCVRAKESISSLYI